MIRFKENCTLAVIESFDEENDLVDQETDESFTVGDEADVDIIERDDTEEFVDLQFGDGTMAFGVDKKLFEVIDDESQFEAGIDF